MTPDRLDPGYDSLELYVPEDDPEPPRSGFALLWGCAALGIWLLICIVVAIRWTLGGGR